MMNNMKKTITFLVVLVCVVFLACGNKERQTVPMVYDDQPVMKESQADTASTSAQIESPKAEEKPSTDASSSSSSSRTSKSTKYDNMRGFDPSSEDDMDDNGMSRYMENNDEEGWD